MNNSTGENTDSRPLTWQKSIVVLALLSIPFSYAVYAHLSGENHFGQGLERSFYRPAFWAVQAMAFLGLTVTPCLRIQSERRHARLMLLGTLGFLITEALSFAFIAFSGFPD